MRSLLTITADTKKTRKIFLSLTVELTNTHFPVKSVCAHMEVLYTFYTPIESKVVPAVEIFPGALNNFEPKTHVPHPAFVTYHETIRSKHL